MVIFGTFLLWTEINKQLAAEAEKQALIDEFINQIEQEEEGPVDDGNPVENPVISGTTIGVMRIPTIGLTAPIGYGVSLDVLKKQVGMYKTTDKFITFGGNTGFAAHTSFRGGCSYCYFFHLRDVKIGDEIHIDYRDGITYTFKVIEIMNDMSIKADIPYKYKKEGSALITLSTCSDYGHKRDFVVAEYVNPADGIR